MVAARRLVGEGRFGPAAAVLEELSRALRGSCDDRASHRDALTALVFGAWVEVVCVEVAPARAERVLYELSRTDAQSPLLDRLRVLARATLDVSRDPPRALEKLEALGPFEEPSIERARANVRVLAARSLSEEGEAEVVRDVARWVAASGDPIAQARLLGWQGRLAYRMGEYDRAAELHLAAAEALEGPIERVGALSNAASALLEAFRPMAALAVVERARAELTRRSPHMEARLEWLARAAAYRLEEPQLPDLDLVIAVDREGLSFMLPLVRLTEAAIAWRAGEQELARELAETAAAGWRAIRTLPELAAMAEALSAACGSQRDVTALAALADAAMAFRTPGIGLQTLGLLALAGVALGDRHTAAAGRLAAEIAPERRRVRMDVLSTHEAERALRL